MPYLKWISDRDLKEAVGNLLNKASEALRESEADFTKNVIDPFSAIFQISGFGIDYDFWVTSEKARKSQKSLQNHVGDFHQKVLGKVDDWDDKRTGEIIDLVSVKNKIVAEIKNKFNTVKGDHLSGVYRDIESLVLDKNSIYHNYAGYYVTIIPKKPARFNYPFTPSDSKIGKRLPPEENIRHIDGASFYELVTGYNSALVDLFHCLPQVIAEINDVELKKEDQKMLSDLFFQAFGS